MIEKRNINMHGIDRYLPPTMPRSSNPNRSRADEVCRWQTNASGVVKLSHIRHRGTSGQPIRLVSRDGEDACSNLTSCTQLFSIEVRLDIAQRYHAWVLVNRKRAESPLDDPRFSKDEVLPIRPPFKEVPHRQPFYHDGVWRLLRFASAGRCTDEPRFIASV